MPPLPSLLVSPAAVEFRVGAGLSRVDALKNVLITVPLVFLRLLSAMFAPPSLIVSPLRHPVIQNSGEAVGRTRSMRTAGALRITGLDMSEFAAATVAKSCSLQAVS